MNWNVTKRIRRISIGLVLAALPNLSLSNTFTSPRQAGGIDSGGGFIVSPDIPVSETVLRETFSKLPKVILEIYNQMSRLQKFNRTGLLEARAAQVEALREVLSEEDLAEITFNFENLEKAEEKVFLSPNFRTLVENATVAIEDGPCFARDGSERDASVVHPESDICLSIGRIKQKVNMSDRLEKTLPLMFKEYGRLAGLTETEAEVFQGFLVNYSVTNSSYSHYNDEIDENWDQFNYQWEDARSNIDSSAEATEICLAIGSLKGSFGRHHIHIGNNLSRLTHKEYIKAHQITVRIDPLSRFCTKIGPVSKAPISLRELYDQDQPDAPDWFTNEVFADDVFVMPIAPGNKEDLIKEMNHIEKDINSFNESYRSDS